MKHNPKIVLFISRNKDNKNVEGFKQRSYSFLTSEYTSVQEETNLFKDFNNFVDKGVLGETSRWYMSINERDSNKVNNKLIHYLVDHPEMNPASIPSKSVSLAQSIECAVTKKWLFDFDSDDYKNMLEFKEDIHKIIKGDKQEIVHYETMNGYEVIVPHGFDTRDLLAKWNKEETIVEVKRDGMLLLDWNRRV
ncbi:hypothetical protein LW81_051 [Lactococcus phage LW81]|uniref:Uncharacterized protein n=1 Tax=Lactococcus phage LW81 TaxID=1965482 RepID=A0A1W6JN04_9CAUD|nr:hypothetical protein H1Z34_gp051 [Lactococcus phage LW81]ARM67621.1 hypothetical protein LW81_051 [Lactococcus phage LW81]